MIGGEHLILFLLPNTNVKTALQQDLCHRQQTPNSKALSWIRPSVETSGEQIKNRDLSMKRETH